MVSTLMDPYLPGILDFEGFFVRKENLSCKMAGHSAAGVLLHCRPRVVSLASRNGTYGSYRLDPRDAQGERAAMVALAGTAALLIEETKFECNYEYTIERFLKSALASDLGLAYECLPEGARTHYKVILTGLFLRVHDLLLTSWPLVTAISNRLFDTHDTDVVDGPTLGRIYRAYLASQAAVPQ